MSFDSGTSILAQMRLGDENIERMRSDIRWFCEKLLGLQSMQEIIRQHNNSFDVVELTGHMKWNAGRVHLPEFNEQYFITLTCDKAPTEAYPKIWYRMSPGMEKDEISIPSSRMYETWIRLVELVDAVWKIKSVRLELLPIYDAGASRLK